MSWLQEHKMNTYSENKCQNKNWTKILRSKVKTSKKVRSKKASLFKKTGSETPQIAEYVYNMPKLRKIVFQISPGVYWLKFSLSRKKVSTLKLLAHAINWSRVLHTEFELHSRYVQKEKLRRTSKWPCRASTRIIKLLWWGQRGNGHTEHGIR